MTIAAIRCAKFLSNRHHQQDPVFYDRMSFLSPNQQRHSTEGKLSWALDRRIIFQGGGANDEPRPEGPRLGRVLGEGL